MRHLTALFFALTSFVQLVAAQASAVPAAAAPAVLPAYRGFVVGLEYKTFAQRARAMQRSVREPLVCTTSRRTAQLMECRVVIRDTTDSAVFELGAHFIDGRAGFLSFGDSGGPARVEQLQAELRRTFGPPASVSQGTWQWGDERHFTRLNWRGRGEVRWIYLTLTDLDVLDQVRRYITPAPAPRPPTPPPAGARPGG